MAFTDYLSGFEETASELEDLIAQVEADDIAVAASQEAELRKILQDLEAGVDYRKVGDELRVDLSSPATRNSINRARRQLTSWRLSTLASFRATDPASFLSGQSTLGEMSGAMDLATRKTRALFDRLDDADRFTAAQVDEAKDFQRQLARMRRRHGETLREFFGDILDEASFGKIENIAAGVNAGVREPTNFLARWGSGAQGPIGGVVRGTEAQRRDLSNLIATWKLNRNQLRLSSTAHVRGLVNTVFIRLSEAIGVSHFMFYVAKENRDRLAGLSAQELFQVRLGEPSGSEATEESFAASVANALGRTSDEVEKTARAKARQAGEDTAAKRREFLARMLKDAETVKTWPDMYQTVNQGRVSTVPWASNLTIHHGSMEWYLPIPPSLLSEARAWAGSVRSRRAA